jgi:hypothetical protein
LVVLFFDAATKSAPEVPGGAEVVGVLGHSAESALKKIGTGFLVSAGCIVVAR